MELTVADTAERLGVSRRRVRSLIERGQLPAVRRGTVWLTTTDAADTYRRNAPGPGRPIAAATAWDRIRDLARTGSFGELHDARVALRARAVHRTYRLGDLLERRLGTPAGTFRSGLDVLGVAEPGRAVDLYGRREAIAPLLAASGGVVDPAGTIHLHLLADTQAVPELNERERLVLAWCDLADRADPAADAAALQLWPDAVEILHLAEMVGGSVGTPFTQLRALVDWTQRHPYLATAAVSRAPAPTGDGELDSLYAAVAETIAELAGERPPEWCARVEPALPAIATPDDALPESFARRGISMSRDTFWRTR